ncbi:hypothetical protein RS86_00834 [Microbacterium azadirachtae]|uniref:Uncharacterized protein n=2 Tax=Microbacterium azadirachtae TaxID=582680 RepID=A0A0F0LPG4_9MICO|nr:hypothetical protein RS86_00834 [Microbacterium azadirachtae]
MKPIHPRAGDDKLGGTEGNGRMDMTEPQVWTLIGVFAAIMLGGMTLMTTLLTKAIGGRLAALEGTFDGKFEAMDGRITGLRNEMNARFDAMDVKVSALDKGVAALAERFWRS